VYRTIWGPIVRAWFDRYSTECNTREAIAPYSAWAIIGAVCSPFQRPGHRRDLSTTSSCIDGRSWTSHGVHLDELGRLWLTLSAIQVLSLIRTTWQYNITARTSGRPRYGLATVRHRHIAWIQKRNQLHNSPIEWPWRNAALTRERTSSL